MQSFNTTVTDLIDEVIDGNALANQKAYMLHVKKPFGLTVPRLAARLKRLNAYTQLFPGSNGTFAFD